MRIVLIIVLFWASNSFGQLISGAIKDEGRAILNSPAFIVEGRVDGFAKFELAVNREGKVTSVKPLDSNLKSTPARYELRNYVSKFTFKKGTYYPKFHHVVVKVSMMKSRE